MSITSKIKAEEQKMKELFKEKKKLEEVCKILELQFVTQEKFEYAIISDKPFILK